MSIIARLFKTVTGTDDQPDLPLVESFYCPTTGKAWTTVDYQTMPHPTMVQRWAACPFCDQHGRSGRHYDASEPQPHVAAYHNGERVQTDA